MADAGPGPQLVVRALFTSALRALVCAALAGAEVMHWHCPEASLEDARKHPGGGLGSEARPGVAAWHRGKKCMGAWLPQFAAGDSESAVFPAQGRRRMPESDAHTEE